MPNILGGALLNTRARRISTALTILALASTGALTFSAAAAAAPVAPQCAAVHLSGDEYTVSWKRPASDSPVWRYVTRVKGVEGSWLRIDGPRWQDNPVREISRTASGSPVFMVRAVNHDGSSAWCSTDPPTTDPPTTDPPTTDPPTTDPPTTEPPTTDPPAGSLPYSADSFFKSRVTGAPIDSTRTSRFHSFMAEHPDQGGKGITWPKINVNENWAMSYHVGKASDPVWKLTGNVASEVKVATTQGFHMADSVADTFPDGDQDRPGVMIDPVFGYTIQFADAVPNKATRTIHVSNAGIMYHSSNGLDKRNPLSDDQRNFTSRGRIIDAMVVRRDLLDKAIANNTGLGHVLHLFFVETKSADGEVHPMTGSEGGNDGFGAQGERIRIKPSVDLKARGLTGAALAIARTMQENGAYIGDNSGSSTQIKASQPHNYTGTNVTTNALKGKVFWNDFEVVQRGWQ